jgi:hypothetical protein
LFPEFLFILVRSPCKNLNSYDNPFWDFSNGGNNNTKSGIISKIVATYVYASSQGQRTHSAHFLLTLFHREAIKKGAGSIIIIIIIYSKTAIQIL